MQEKTKGTLTIKADRPAYGGLCIAKVGGGVEGRVVMIRGAVPGETVEARIDEEKKDYVTATATKILEPSPDRVSAACKYFGSCGGCQLQYVAYERQVAIKEEVLKDCMRRIAGIDITPSVPLFLEPYNYRRRGQFKAARGKMGLYREKSREVVDIASCPLMSENVNEYLGKARGLLKGVDVSEVHISCGDGAGAIALIKAGRASGSNWGALARGFLGAGFSGVFVEQEGRRLLKRGQEYMTFDLDGQQYTVSPMSFFQGNWGLNRALVKLVRDGLLPLEGKRVLDIYSGAGNFSLPIALHASEVVAVEENPFAVADGKRNIEINGVKNCTFIRSSADTFDFTSTTFTGDFDIIIADPPRTGLTDGTVKRILAAGPGRVVYISCNPATLARDLRKLGGEYEVESMRMVDFFPQTYHIESVAFLRKKPR